MPLHAQDIDQFHKTIASMDLLDPKRFMQAINEYAEIGDVPTKFFASSKTTRECFGRLTWTGKMAAAAVIKSILQNKE